MHAVSCALGSYLRPDSIIIQVEGRCAATTSRRMQPLLRARFYVCGYGAGKCKFSAAC